ncbi:MAG: RNA pseudouridine synthase [Saprospiraceae bacterium]|nr:MAG: pseudouridine synthase [Bacteroidetes bacterium OLB9]MCO6464675.1 RNA pseudouridine synthase [Saprospiraceae bacterium]MCZ2339311.1 RNA pseudouridine synthase [Chitinophagales bacterium]
MDLSLLNNLNKRPSFEDDYSIIDETDDFIIIHKKNGIAVQITDKETDDLESMLNARFGEKIYVLNRIDQPVTGLVIFAKNKTFASAFTEMLKDRSVRKTYLAIVAGNPNKEPTELRHYIKKLHNRAMTADEQIDDNFKEAILEYRLVQSFDNYHILKIDLKTGRFHQIRAQLATVDLPIKGDLKYGSKRPNIDRSIGLLSYKLEFIQPFTGKKHTYISPLPKNDVLWNLLDKTLIGD